MSGWRFFCFTLSRRLSFLELFNCLEGVWFIVWTDLCLGRASVIILYLKYIIYEFSEFCLRVWV